MVIYNPSESEEKALTVAEAIHDTALSVDIVDVSGNPIVGEVAINTTVYVSGQLTDVVTGETLMGALIRLSRNGVDTGLTNTTDVSGVYSIPYVTVSADVPSVSFKTVFEGM